MMNTLSNCFAGRKAAMAFFTALLLVAADDASAKDRKVKHNNNQAHVLVHIPFTGLSTVDMTLQRKANNHYYLYVQHGRDQGISVIDVAKPALAKLIGVNPWPDPAVSGRMNLAGGLAIIAETEPSTLPGRTNKDDLVLWDMSNPISPRVVRKFSGVIKWIEDERSFVYVLNGDGLWVISEPTPDTQMEQSNAYDGE
jgi:hypothetical protein